MGPWRRGSAAGQSAQRATDPVILEIRYTPEEAGADSTAHDEQSRGRRAELARQLNASIYQAAQSLAEQGDDDFELTYFCACGCMEEVRRSLWEYVSRGAVIDGHPRPADGTAR